MLSKTGWRDWHCRRTIKVITHAVHCFVEAWNAHHIPGRNRGIPNALAAANNQSTPLTSRDVPLTRQIIQLHQERGGSRDATFGVDPISHLESLQSLRERDFIAHSQRVEEIFEDVLHGDGQLFKTPMHLFISLTQSYSALI